MVPLVRLVIIRLLLPGPQRSTIHPLHLHHLSSSRALPIQSTTPEAARPHPTTCTGDTPRPISVFMVGNHNRPVCQLTRPTHRATTQPSGRLPPIGTPLEAVTSSCVTRWNPINSPVDLSNSRHDKALRPRTVIRARPHWAQTVAGHSLARDILSEAWTHPDPPRVVRVWPRMYTRCSILPRRPSAMTKTSPKMLASESVCNNEP